MYKKRTPHCAAHVPLFLAELLYILTIMSDPFVCAE